MVLYRHESCVIKDCNRAAVDNSRYCTIHQTFWSRIRECKWLKHLPEKLKEARGNRSRRRAHRRQARENTYPPSTTEQMPTKDHGSLLSLTQEHVERMRSADPSTWIFLKKYLIPEIQNLVSFAEDQLITTIEKQVEHNSCYSRSPVFFSTTTLPVALNEARDWFGKENGGYSKHLESIWNGNNFIVSGCNVHFDVVYGYSDGLAWVQIGLYGLGADSPCHRYFLPNDLLTSEERRLVKTLCNYKML